MNELAGLVIFRNPTTGAGLPEEEPEAVETGDCPADYLRSREMAERAAAKRAQSLAARQVHQELAQHYAELARRAG